MSRPNEEVQIPKIRSNGSLEGLVRLRKDHHLVLQTNPYRNHISSVELPTLNPYKTTTLGWELKLESWWLQE